MYGALCKAVCCRPVLPADLPDSPDIALGQVETWPPLKKMEYPPPPPEIGGGLLSTSKLESNLVYSGLV